jgi:hypothetical protein
MMDLSRPSIEKYQKEKEKTNIEEHKTQKKEKNQNQNQKRKKNSIKGSYILRGVEGNANLSCVDKDCHF